MSHPTQNSDKKMKLPKWNHDDVGVAVSQLSELININYRKLNKFFYFLDLIYTL